VYRKEHLRLTEILRWRCKGFHRINQASFNRMKLLENVVR